MATARPSVSAWQTPGLPTRPMLMRFGAASVFESNTPLLHPPRRLTQHGQLRFLQGLIPDAEQRAIA